MSRLLPTLALLAALPPAASPAAAQEAERGGFVARLGTDTLAVERFTRSGNRLEGERLVRSPQATLIRYSADLDGKGRVTRFEAALLPAGRLDGPPNWTGTLEFDGRKAVGIFRRGGEADTARIEARADLVPMLTHSYALVDQMVRQAKRKGGGRQALGMVYPGQAGATGTWVAPHAGDSVAIGSFHDATAWGLLDREGHLRGYDARGTVVKVVAERVPEPDIAAVARAFAAEEAARGPAGPVSPRDTARATLGQARIMVDYSRPARRGRVIFGGLVPWDSVWRTGADAATQFRTTRPLRLGGTSLPAGTYTLWTVPGREGATLLVNRQSGQWGTDHDATQDFARIPLTVGTLPEPVERFTIALVPRGTQAELRLSWDTTVWTTTLELE